MERFNYLALLTWFLIIIKVQPNDSLPRGHLPYDVYYPKHKNLFFSPIPVNLCASWLVHVVPR